MAYTPPNGGQLVLQFGTAYVQPSQPIEFELVPAPNGTVNAFGIGASAFGTQVVYNSRQYVGASGSDSAAFGGATVATLTQVIGAFGFSVLVFGDTHTSIPLSVFATGLSTSSFGSAQVTNFLQYAYPTGISALSMPFPFVYNKNQTIRFAPGMSPLAFGVADVENSRNYLRPSGADSSAFGSAYVAFDLQYIHPASLQTLSFGSTQAINRNATVRPLPLIGTAFGSASVGTDQYVGVPGLSSYATGAHQVADTRQWFFAPGNRHTALGFPFVYNKTQTVIASYPLDQAVFGGAEFYNLKQFLYASSRDEDHPERFGEAFAYNKNQTIGAFGEESLRMRPYHSVRLAADAAQVIGAVATEFGDQLVSHRDRSVRPAGFSSAAVEDRLMVYNNAIPAYPSGMPTAGFGTASVSSNLQTIGQAGARSTQVIGGPFVSHAVRRVFVTQSIEGIVEQPSALLWRQYVTPAGIDAYQTSAAHLEIHRLIASPLGYVHSAFGLPAARNRNQSVGMYGIDQVRFGTQYLRRSFEAYSVGGGDLVRFGEHAVEFRTRVVRPTGFQTAAVSHLATLLKFPPDPPAPRLLLAQGFAHTQFGLFEFLNKSIAPQGLIATQWGSTLVRGNCIFPLGIFEDFIADTRPRLNPTIFVRPLGFGSSIIPRHDMKPRTIWATTATPSQAVANHPGPSYYPIGENDIRGLGAPVASNRIRRITTIAERSMSAFGDQLVGTRPAYIRAVGSRMTKYGIPVLPSGANVTGFGFDMARYGVATVDYYIDPSVPRQIKPSGISVGQIGAHWASTSPQDFFAPAIAAETFGTAWVSHEYPPFNIPGIPSAIAFGDAFVAHRVRSVVVEGEDTFATGPVVGSFRDRMRVVSRARAQMTGFVASEFGRPFVGPAAQHIYAYDIVGAVGTPRITNQIEMEAEGWSSDTFGSAIVDVVEAGKVKPIGASAELYGTPRLRVTIKPAVMLVTQFGAARPSYGVAPAGLTSARFGESAVVGDDGHVCGMAPRAIVARGFVAGTVGPVKVTG